MTQQNDIVFVFGSNEAGIHGKGAARYALDHYGAIWGKSYGHYGDSFAIPTKDSNIKTISNFHRVGAYILGFLAYAEGHPEIKFQVTRIGCGLAGFKDKHVASLFEHAPSNCTFDLKWKEYLGNKHSYWGTYNESI